MLDSWVERADAPALKEGEIHLWLIDLAAAPASLFLTSAETRKAGSFVNRDAARRYRHVRSAVRRLLADYAGQPALELAIEPLPGGKPHLPGHPNIHFNLSHTGDTALLGVSEWAPLGVDIERRRHFPSERMLRIAGRVLPTEACARIASVQDTGRAAIFTREWTLHEAYQKASGNGVFGPRSRDGRWFHATMQLPGDLVASIVVTASASGTILRHFRLDQAAPAAETEGAIGYDGAAIQGE